MKSTKKFFIGEMFNKRLSEQTICFLENTTTQEQTVCLRLEGRDYGGTFFPKIECRVAAGSTLEITRTILDKSCNTTAVTSLDLYSILCFLNENKSTPLTLKIAGDSFGEKYTVSDNKIEKTNAPRAFNKP